MRNTVLEGAGAEQFNFDLKDSQIIGGSVRDRLGQERQRNLIPSLSSEEIEEIRSREPAKEPDNAPRKTSQGKEGEGSHRPLVDAPAAKSE